MKNLFKLVFPQTLPVLAGYLFLGIAYGIMMQEAGYGVLWSFLSSLFIYAGSAQILSVSLLAAHANLIQVAILIFVLNFRHFFYGLSMISKYKNCGPKKLYLIFGLTDETYAILSGKELKGLNKVDYYFLTTILDQCYWVGGSVIGALIGGLIPFELTGIDFAMTALFAVLVVEQWKAHKKHAPALIGFFVSIVALIVLGPNNFIIPALIIISVILLIFKGKLDEKEELFT